jgi:hypothetical protein
MEPMAEAAAELRSRLSMMGRSGERAQGLHGCVTPWQQDRCKEAVRQPL